MIDLVVQHGIDPDYLRPRNGKIDLSIVLVTFPYYLIPGVSGGSAILLVARLARVVRFLLATAGLRRFAGRLGKVTLIAGAVLVLASLAAYQAEHKTNPEFATVGDSLWWGIVTLTTVGYGDIVPKTTAGRFCAVAIMITGIAVLGILAGSLASLFNLETPAEGGAGQDGSSSEPAPRQSVSVELASRQAQLLTIQYRLGQLAERISGSSGDAE